MLLRSALNHRIQFACVYKSCIFLALSSVSCILALIFFNAICLCQLHWKRKTCLPILCLSLALFSSLHFSLFWAAPISIKSWSHWTVSETRDSPQAKQEPQIQQATVALQFLPLLLPLYFFGSVFFSIWISYWPISVRPKLLPLLKTGSRVICNTFFARIFRANCNYS